MSEWIANFFGSVTFGDVLSVVGYSITLLTGLWLFLRKLITKDNLKNIGVAFNETVKGLAADKVEDRLAAAIVMRRFFDEGTEYGVGGAPFAKTALSVISALLKHTPTSDFQKVLADSIAYAPSRCLIKSDFQRANLSKAYLGKINFEGADFFQANLSGASLKEASAVGAIFREATVIRTVFKGANLRGANFDLAVLQSVSFNGADLTGAKFNGATLREVDFSGAKLDDVEFGGSNGYGNIGVDGLINPAARFSAGRKVFLSRPGQLDSRQMLFVDSAKTILVSKNFEVVELDRDRYDTADVLSNLNKLIGECNALLAFGFQSIIIKDGLYRLSTIESRSISNVHISTPWNHVEIAMAVVHGLPILALADDEVEDGVFGGNINDRLLTKDKIRTILADRRGVLDVWLKSLGSEV